MLDVDDMDDRDWEWDVHFKIKEICKVGFFFILEY